MDEEVMELSDALSPKIKINNPVSKNIVPLNGFPETQAKTETENTGKEINIANNLLDGVHLNNSKENNK